MRYLGWIIAVWALVWGASPAVANHLGVDVCPAPATILAGFKGKLPSKPILTWISLADAHQYLEILERRTGTIPQFDPTRIKGGVVIRAPHVSKIFLGVVDGDGGTVCHAIRVDADLNREILGEISKGKA